ncbi:hypothetical protein L226DRAFT_617800 [Lentinus tigrinus ALCF2SS1-7]|uniref:Uncharacterized protein n=1 Tax=Lentinus tigrinus ALCF2SS1-6 TaxID=1328759 RepID=A0A5C2SL89_9APHY|nr:hypothetical protein L227DRAFT_650655 [Lentinus tigrinus ALCF2SS1-6]RPD67947.1 hypothetical protein L226DRAFT_617800 [Lentinus tigrinus ALCF2SS1-7]
MFGDLSDEFLNGDVTWRPNQERRRANVHASRLHCEKVAAELRAAGRSGPGRTVSEDEFIHLFLTREQLEYLYWPSRLARMVTPLTIPELRPPSANYYAPPISQDPSQAWLVCGGIPPRDHYFAKKMMKELETFMSMRRWSVIWPELRNAMLRYIPDDLWPWALAASSFVPLSAVEAYGVL